MLGVNDASGKHVHVTLRDPGGFNLVTSLSISTSKWKVKLIEITIEDNTQCTICIIVITNHSYVFLFYVATSIYSTINFHLTNSHRFVSIMHASRTNGKLHIGMMGFEGCINDQTRVRLGFGLGKR
jgi:hypothetical protein